MRMHQYLLLSIALALSLQCVLAEGEQDKPGQAPSDSESVEDLEAAASSNEDIISEVANSQFHADKHVSSDHELKEAGHIIENRVQAPPHFHQNQFPVHGFPFNAHGLIQAPSNVHTHQHHHLGGARGLTGGHSHQYVNIQHHPQAPWPQDGQPAHAPPQAPVFHPPQPQAQTQHHAHHQHQPVFQNEGHHEEHHEEVHEPAGQHEQDIAAEHAHNVHQHAENEPPVNAVAPVVSGHGVSSHVDPEEAWPISQPDMPKIVHLDVKCEKNLMKVVVEFDRPFNGLIFSKGALNPVLLKHKSNRRANSQNINYGPGKTKRSLRKRRNPSSNLDESASQHVAIQEESETSLNNVLPNGHYSYGSCVHLPAGSGKKSVFFDISINSCGTVGNAQNGLYGQEGNTATGSFFENTIIIQYDPQVQEVWDQARKLRCTWHNNYEKAVTFRPFPVDMLDVVRADFAGDNVGCWMQIQAGKGPWASEVAGIVKIGQTMTMVLAIKDDENKFDMLVRNCIAHDGQRAPIELVDSHGCVARPKLMSRFTKIRNFGSSATVLSYAHFQAFKFPDTMEVHFQCTIQICRYQCPEQCTPKEDQQTASSDTRNILYSTTLSRQERDLGRFRRDVNVDDGEEKDIGVSKIIRVLSAGDVDFSLGNSSETQSVEFTQEELASVVCMSTWGFASSLLLLLLVLMATCMMCAFLYIRHKTHHTPVFKGFNQDLPVFKKTKEVQ